MEKPIFKLLFPFVVFFLVFVVLTPHFTSNFMDLRQKEEERAAKEAEEKAEKILYLMGHFDPVQKENFVPVAPEYNLTPNKIYLRKETYEAFLAMRAAAEKDGVDLKVASATRNFEYQKGIWDKKWEGYTVGFPDGSDRFGKILEYSAVPGASRHHWGTDIDINGASPEYFDGESGKKVYEWLTENAPLFGFCQTYTKRNPDRTTGYNEEKWHWSYLPLARDFTKEYENLIQEENIQGFAGDEYVSNFDLIHDYVLSINPNCI